MLEPASITDGAVGSADQKGLNVNSSPKRSFQKLLRIILSTPSGVVGFGVVAAHVVVALIAPAIVLHDPLAQDPNQIMAAPSWTHPFGTDLLGRDVLSRTLEGGRVAIAVTALSALLALIGGAAIGITAAMRGGWFDSLTMRLVESIGALPYLLFLLVLANAFPGSAFALVPALAIFYSTSIVRVSRAAALSVASADFVTAARVRGEKAITVLLREVLPNVLDVVLVDGALRWASMLLGFSSLSFLGFGVAPPTPDWGLMISDARNVMAIAPWAVFWPCVALSTLILGAIFLADAASKAVGLQRAPEGLNP
ncbi:ABC transporter permease [Mesorhizobium tianshanense]|uniref:Peptide/nickel transport system permease protein n=1 Tax=Mesorhizobium tianshanense TaxID=39844 RepID=A0A562NLR2_9HYPH|nr:ABC transporter permease [Mesorhizobium tianshanense]TWI33147.1 peptide/nickel transport system permease protein [Mesorhizobium tianshanense]GLS34982.1 ABC transporter permease [Mesorhizobium tianshanense]